MTKRENLIIKAARVQGNVINREVKMIAGFSLCNNVATSLKVLKETVKLEFHTHQEYLSKKQNLKAK